MRKKQEKQIGIFVIILIIVLFVVFIKFGQFGPFSVGVTSETFVKPSWARIECEKADAENKQEGILPITGGSVFCGRQENTDRCRLNVKISANNLQGVRRVVADTLLDFKIYSRTCNNDGTGCTSERVIADINSNKLDIFFEPGLSTLPAGKKWFIRAKAERKALAPTTSFDMPVFYKKFYNRWDLIRHVGGGKWTVRSGSCFVSGRDDEGVSLNSKILKSESFPNPLTMSGSSGSKWINYVDDWFYGPGTNVFNHPRYGEVYCSAGQIFNIIKLQFKDGSLKKLDPAYQGRLPDGQSLKGLGNRLAGVECCPNEPNCGDDFEFKPEPTPKECFSDIQCYNTGNPVPASPTSYVKHICSSEGKCEQSQVFPTECTRDDVCIAKHGAGYACDLSLTNYGKCVKQQVGAYCGDGACNPLTENKETCPDDCGKPPSEDVCRDKCDMIKTGILHPTGSIAKQVCQVKCGVISFWEKYKILIIVGIIGLFVLGIAILIKISIIKLPRKNRRR